MNIKIANVPHVARDQRLTADDQRFNADGISHLHACFGFQDRPNVPATLQLAVEHGLLPAADLEEVTYFLSRITVVRSPEHNMPAWQKRLFLAIAHNAAHPVDYFALPTDLSISMGAEIPI